MAPMSLSQPGNRTDNQGPQIGNPATGTDQPATPTGTDSPALRIDNLCFAYPKQPALFDHFNLEIPAGKRFGLFGPNGAGKTTLMYLMTGLLQPSAGSIRIFGKTLTQQDLAVRALFGFIPQDFSFYQELSPVENLAFFGAWSGLPRNVIRERTAQLLDILGLAEVKDKRVAQFSGGMKRRVNLAIGVIHRPKLLFLDEPTVGVDVQTRHAIIRYLKQLNDEGTTLVYTSHQLVEAEDLCEMVALIDQGRIVAYDDLDRLLSTHRMDGLEGLFLELTGKEYRDL
jgi:ABC-2 type transport system ATP-binding protein